MRRSLAILSALLLAAGTDPAQAGTPSFLTAVPLQHVIRTGDVTLRTRAQKAIYSSLKHSGTTVQLARTDIAKLGAGSPVTMEYLGRRYTIRPTHTTRRGAGDFTWYGDVPGVHGRAIFVVRRGRTTGAISGDGGTITVSSIAGGITLMAQRKAFPPDHPASFKTTQKAARARFEPLLAGLKVLRAAAAVQVDEFQAQLAPQITHQRILVGYTPNVLQTHPDVLDMIRVAIEQTNTAYQTSGVQVALDLADTFQTDFVEAGTVEGDLELLTGEQLVRCTQRKAGADLVIVLIEDDDACGDSAAIFADADTAYSVVNAECAVGNLSFAHEVGHLQGARHDLKNDPASPFDNGHGFAYPPGHWRDIMAYPCDEPATCDRQPFFSNPAKIHDGVATGDNTSNNAWVINHTAPSIAALHKKLADRDCRTEPR